MLTRTHLSIGQDSPTLDLVSLAYPVCLAAITLHALSRTSAVVSLRHFLDLSVLYDVNRGR